MKLLRSSSARFGRTYEYSYPQLRTHRPRISRRVAVTGKQELPDSSKRREEEGRARL